MSAAVCPFTDGAIVIEITVLATITTESSPPRLSTCVFDSFTWFGTKIHAVMNATTASGTVMRNTDPHQNLSSRPPATSGPIADIALPMPDHSAIGRVRDVPDHSAVMSANVVGNAMPAATPPAIRAHPSTTMLGAYAATRHAGTERAMPTSRRCRAAA